MIKRKLKLMGALLFNGWVAIFGLRFIEGYSQILLIAGMISFTLSIVLSSQVIKDSR